jgi:aspartate racemase
MAAQLLYEDGWADRRHELGEHGDLLSRSERGSTGTPWLASMPLLLRSFDFAEIAALQAAGNWSRLSALLVDAARRLERAGAEALVNCSNTMYKLTLDVAAAVEVPMKPQSGDGNRCHRPISSNRIGLIGGLALRAGIFYYEQILRRYDAYKKPLDLVLCHADVGKVLAYINNGDRVGMGDYLGTLANDLFDSRAKLVAITAVAPHLAIKEIAQVARGPLINVLDTITVGLQEANFSRVAVFGNRAVVQTNVFGAIPDNSTVKLEPSVIEAIHATYSEIALRGKRGTEPEMQHLSRLARALIEKNGAQAIVLAGTDLSSFYAEQKPDYPFLDMAQLHIEQILRFS